MQPDANPRFNGPDYIPKLDQLRLTKQHERIRDLMCDGKWRTLAEIREMIYRIHGRLEPEASISAQLRHLRKLRFGSWLVNKRRRGDVGSGLYEYQLQPQIYGDAA